jgi:hypothetical protein
VPALAADRLNFEHVAQAGVRARSVHVRGIDVPRAQHVDNVLDGITGVQADSTSEPPLDCHGRLPDGRHLEHPGLPHTADR